MAHSKYLGILLLIVFFASCHNKLPRYSRKRNTTIVYSSINDTTLMLDGISSDPNFGRTEKKPISLGLVDVHKAADNIEYYLNALEGPSKETITFNRMKPCCPFKTENFTYVVPFFNMEMDHGHGMLERYEVIYESNGKTERVILYFNLFDQTKKLLAPHGFAFKKN